MKTTNYNIRLDPEIKIKAEKTFAVYGLNLSEAINVFLHTSILRRGFPFELREPRLNTETVLAVQETDQIIEEYKTGIRKPRQFTNAHDMFEFMDKEEEADGVNE